MLFNHQGSPVGDLESPSPANTSVKIVGVPTEAQPKDAPIDVMEPAIADDPDIQVVPKHQDINLVPSIDKEVPTSDPTKKSEAIKP